MVEINNNISEFENLSKYYIFVDDVEKIRLLKIAFGDKYINFI